MIIPRYLLFLVLPALFVSCTGNVKSSAKDPKVMDTLLISTAFNQYFKDCRVEGNIVIFNDSQGKWIVNDTSGWKTGTLPASTFKIINLLIALETGVIKDEKEIVRWVGKTDTAKYGYRPDIYHDMTVKEAFEVSAGWVFIELAKKIGKEKYRHYLQACDYGNQDCSHHETDFWNFGALCISPFEQVNFLRKFYKGNLPFSRRNIEIVKKVMISEQTDNYTIRAKTGWTRQGGMNTGWWVGYVETKQGVHFFATRLLQERKINSPDFGSCRKEITRSVLKDLHVLID